MSACSTTTSNGWSWRCAAYTGWRWAAPRLARASTRLPGFDKDVAAQIAQLTGLPFVTAPNKFAVQGAHDDLVHLSATLKTLAVSLFKIANDIRLLSCGPAPGFAELKIPANEPGSSIMPGKVNPTQCEALAMIAIQVMANDMAVAVGGASGYLEMNVYKPLLIFNIAKSIRLMTDGCTNFRKFLVEGTEPNLKQIGNFVERSLMLVTALSPVIGYDKASKVAHYALDHDLTLKEAALQLGGSAPLEFDRVVDPKKMVEPYVGWELNHQLLHSIHQMLANSIQDRMVHFAKNLDDGPLGKGINLVDPNLSRMIQFSRDEIGVGNHEAEMELVRGWKSWQRPRYPK